MAGRQGWALAGWQRVEAHAVSHREACIELHASACRIIAQNQPRLRMHWSSREHGRADHPYNKDAQRRSHSYQDAAHLLEQDLKKGFGSTVCTHLFQVASLSLGRMRRRPSEAAARASAAMLPQLTHHCGFRTGSMTSLDRLHMPSRIALGAVPRNRPSSLSQSTTVTLAW